MNKHFVHLSLFDGISAGQVAMNRVLPRKTSFTYYSSEIDQDAIEVTNHNYPNTVQLGDVRHLRKDMIPYAIDIITGGSPCQDFSIAGRRKGMTTEEKIEITNLNTYLNLKNQEFQFIGQSYLFWEFVLKLKTFDPKYFVLENVRMTKKWEQVITNALGVEPLRINSALMSAQNRERLYWTNIPNVSIPEDKNICLSDIIPGARGCGYRGIKKKGETKYTQTLTIRSDTKANCLVTTNSPTQRYITPAGIIKDMTPEVWERLQTFPTGYTRVNGLNKTARYKALGNSWTVDVIEHIFKHIPEIN